MRPGAYIQQLRLLWQALAQLKGRGGVAADAVAALPCAPACVQGLYDCEKNMTLDTARTSTEERILTIRYVLIYR